MTEFVNDFLAKACKDRVKATIETRSGRTLTGMAWTNLEDYVILMITHAGVTIPERVSKLDIAKVSVSYR